MRLSYISSVYRYEQLQSGKQREVAQAGIELLGAKGPEADAEVIAMAIEAFLELGLTEFQIDIGQVEFFKGLVEEAGLGEDEAEELRQLIDRKNMLALELFLKKRSIPVEVKNNLMGLPMLYGNGTMLKEAMRLSKNNRCQNAIDNIDQVYGILKNYGLSQYITFDLGMVQSLNYYTGIVFRGYTYGVGFPILSGGRYDRLVSKFGRDCEATGFSLGINMVMMALERQRKQSEQESGGVFVTYEKNARKLAGDYCRQLIRNNCIAELDIMQMGTEESKKYAALRGFNKFVCIKNDGSREEIML